MRDGIVVIVVDKLFSRSGVEVLGGHSSHTVMQDGLGNRRLNDLSNITTQVVLGAYYLQEEAVTVVSPFLFPG